MINVLATFTVITTGNTLLWSLYHSQWLLYWQHISDHYTGKIHKWLLYSQWSLYWQHSQWSLYWHDSQMITTDNIHSDCCTGIHNDHCTDNIHGDHCTGSIHSDHCTGNIHSDHYTDNFHSDHCTDNIHSDHWTGNIHSNHYTSHFIVITVLATYAFTITFAYLLSCRLWKESKREKREVTFHLHYYWCRCFLCIMCLYNVLQIKFPYATCFKAILSSFDHAWQVAVSR